MNSQAFPKRRRISKSLPPPGTPFRKGRIPDTPGVYFFLGRPRSGLARGSLHPKPARAGRVLYIGRAASLRNRVRSYFAPDIAEKRSSWIAKMLTEAKSINFRKTDSVLEAILLEAYLIKKLQPPYNTEQKDDKSFNCIVITDESFPALMVARQKNIDFSSVRIKPARRNLGAGGDEGLKIRAVYGPFPHGEELQTALKIIRKIFPFRDDTCTPCPQSIRGHSNILKNVGMLCRPCFNRQIGLCPGVCTGEIREREYAKTIRNIRLFFEGKKPRLLKLLKSEMNAAAKAQEFEKASVVKKTIFALQHIQEVALLKTFNFTLSTFNFRIEAYDLSHFGGKEIVGAMAVVLNGVAQKSEYRLFKLRGIRSQNEVAGLQEIIRRRLNHPEWLFPDLIVVDGNEVQKNAAEKILKEWGRVIPVAAVVKDERHRPREILNKMLAVGQPSYIPRNVGIWSEQQELHAAILLANSEAHRFVLKFQRRQRLVKRTAVKN